MGRICGCMLGKPIEGIVTKELIPLLKETDNYPMHRYIYKSDITDVYFKNINITTPDGIPQGTGILSKESNSTIENIFFENIIVNGKKCSADDLGISIGENATNINFN